jgi:hypothetical protein
MSMRDRRSISIRYTFITCIRVIEKPMRPREPSFFFLRRDPSETTDRRFVAASVRCDSLERDLLLVYREFDAVALMVVRNRTNSNRNNSTQGNTLISPYLVSWQ